MKLLLLLLALLTGILCALAQPAPDTLWTRAFGSAAVEWGYGAAATSDGDHLFTGTKANASTDIMVVRADPAGTQLWSRTYGSTGTDAGRAITATLAGNIIVAATRGTQIWVLALSGSGDSLWARPITNPIISEPAAILANEDGSIVVAGIARNPNGSDDDFFAAKLSSTGEIIWSEAYDNSGSERAQAIAQTTDGYVLTGTATPTGSGYSDVHVIRIDQAGSEIWNRTFGDPVQSEIAVGIGSIGEDFLVGGQTTMSGAATNLRAWRLNSTGTVTWTRTYNTSLAEIAGGAAVTTDQGIAIGGYQTSAGEGYNVIMIKYTLTGSLAWTKTLGGTQNDFCEGLTATNDGGLIGVGMTRSFGHGETDFYCVRLAGLSGVTGVVTNRLDGQPVTGVRVSALGQITAALTDRQGRYTLAIPPGTATVTISGNCVEPDSIPNVVVLQDSFHVLNASVLLTDIDFDQSSINIVAPNHGSASEPLQISNPGEGQLYFSITSRTIQPTGNWLSTSPSFGVLNAGAIMEVMVTVAADTSNIGVFDFFGELTLRVNSCPDSIFHVDVTATIVNDADDARPELPTQLSLSAYPNPFNPSTSLRLELPQSSHVELLIFDLSGRLVATLLDEDISAGVRDVYFDGAALSTGVYFANLRTATGTTVTKLLLMK